MAWLAVRTRDDAAVARVLGLRTEIPANWRSGLAGAGEGLFVAPPLRDFVCAIGSDAWQRGDFAAIGKALERLSATHGEAFWFVADDRGECFGWAMARGGSLARAFCFDGTDHRVLWDAGAVTVAETRLGFFVDDPRDRSDDPIKWWPVADDVLALAAQWTVDPRRPHAAARGTGRLGRW